MNHPYLSYVTLRPKVHDKRFVAALCLAIRAFAVPEIRAAFIRST
jgi:hypothetical protein